MYCKLVKYMKPWRMLTLHLVDKDTLNYTTELKKGMVYVEQEEKKSFHLEEE